MPCEVDGLDGRICRHHDAVIAAVHTAGQDGDEQALPSGLEVRKAVEGAREIRHHAEVELAGDLLVGDRRATREVLPIPMVASKHCCPRWRLNRRLLVCDQEGVALVLHRSDLFKRIYFPEGGKRALSICLAWEKQSPCSAPSGGRAPPFYSLATLLPLIRARSKSRYGAPALFGP